MGPSETGASNEQERALTKAAPAGVGSEDGRAAIEQRIRSAKLRLANDLARAQWLMGRAKFVARESVARGVRLGGAVLGGIAFLGLMLIGSRIRRARARRQIRVTWR